MGCECVNSPPDWFLDQLAATLCNRLHLQLFNFDLVRPTKHNASGTSRILSETLCMLMYLLCLTLFLVSVHRVTFHT